MHALLAEYCLLPDDPLGTWREGPYSDFTSGQATWARVEGTTLPDLIFNDEAEATIKSLSLPYCVSLDKFAAMNGSIVTPTVTKPSDRAWWKSASVYQSELYLQRT